MSVDSFATAGGGCGGGVAGVPVDGIKVETTVEWSSEQQVG